MAPDFGSTINGNYALLISCRKSFCLVFLVVACVKGLLPTANGDTPYQPRLSDVISESWRWREYPQVKGLGVGCIDEGPDGAMWFGIDGGALRYDGVAWDEFGSEQGLAAKVIAFATTKHGFFAATRDAIYVFKQDGWEEIFPGKTDRTWVFEDLIGARDASLWVATNWGALRIQSGLPDESTSTLYATESIAQHFATDDKVSPFRTVVVETPEVRPWRKGLGMYVYGPIPNGQTVIGLAPGGPAARAGVRVGDQIVAIGDEDRLTVYQTEIEPKSNDTIALKVKSAKSADPIRLELTPEDVTGSVNLFRPYCIVEGNDGTLWFATRLGAIISLSSPDGPDHQWKNHTRESKLPKIAIPSLAATAHGVAGVGRSTNTKALIQFDGEEWSFRDLPRAIGSSIASLTDGLLLVGSGGTIISINKMTGAVRTKKDFGVTGNDVMIKQSSDGAIWVAGKASTLFRIEPNGEHWTSYDGINYQDTAPDGTEWFISRRLSVVKREGDTWREYDTTDGLMTMPMTLLATASGEIWAAGSHHGVAATARFENGRWAMTEHPRLSWSIDRRSVFEDRDGRVWFGGAALTNTSDEMVGGAIRFDGKHWTHIEPTNRLTHVYEMCQTRDGSIWCGGATLVQILPDDHFGPLTDVPGKAHGYCETCTADRDGNLWVGTRSHGLMQMTLDAAGNWSDRWFNETNGISKNRISGVAALSDGSVIVHTYAGFHRFDGKSWNTPALPEQLASKLDYASVRQAPDGAVWLNVSSMRTVSPETDPTKPDFALSGTFRTRRYRPDTRPPETQLNSAISEVLVGDDATFSLSGADPWDVTPASQLTYSWRLDESEWSPFKSANIITLTNLTSGSHRLEVRSRDRDFNMDPTPELAEFRVIPALQDRAWFRVLMLFMLGVLGIAVVQTGRVFGREAKLRAANGELLSAEEELQVANARLEDRVSERTDALKQANQKLVLEIEDRIAAEARLRESEGRYRSLIEILPNGVQRNDLDGTITYVNALQAKLHGCKPTELIGRKIWEFESDSASQESLKTYFRTLVEEQPVPTIYSSQNRTADGRLIDVEVNWTYERDADGQLLGFISIISDVTERKRSERLLLAENELLAAAVQDKPLVQTLNRLTDFVESQSPGVFASLLLRSEDGLRLTHAAGSSLPEAYRDAVDGTLIGEAVGSCGTAAFRGEPVIVSDIANDPLWRDYREIALQQGLAACWSSPIKEPNGEVLGTFAIYCSEPQSPTAQQLLVIETVTHLAAVSIGRHRSQERLKTSEQRFRTMFEQAAAGVGQVHASSGKFLRVNNRYCEILGLNQSEMVGKTWMELTHPDDLEGDKSRIRRLLSGEIREFATEKRLRKKDGDYVWIELNVAAMWRPEVDPTDYIAIVQDITQRKHAEEERERRNQALVKLDETVRGLFVSMRTNEPFFETVCRDIEALIDVDLCAVPMVDSNGETFTYQAARGRNSDVLHGMTASISGGGLCGWVIEHRELLCVRDLSQDERVLTELARKLEVTTAILAPITIDGQVVGGLSVFRGGEPFSDFELRMLNLYAQSVAAAYDNRRTLSSLENRVAERTMELAETNAELESFARTVSHDLRAPLRAMEGFATALVEDYGHQVEEEGREFIQHIIDSAKRLDGMVADLLAYSRLGRTELRVSSYSLNDILDEVQKRLSAQISEKDANLQIASQMPAVVGHKSTLIQVVTNLVSNALKFVAEGEVPEVNIWSERTDEGMVRLTVEDNGIGIEKAYRKRIFQVFERLHGIESYPGTGIGLAIVGRACERLGGSYGMDSTPGKGSAFWVEFPEGQIES